MGRRRGLLVIAFLLVAQVAFAGTVAIRDVHAEADVADEAGAVTLLVRSALAGPDVTLVDAPDVTLTTAPVVLAKGGMTHVVLMELARDGTGLRLTLAVVGADNTREVSFVRAGDGDVQALARGAVDHAVTLLHVAKRDVPTASLGALRPYATALRLRQSDKAAAAKALADADPATALAVPATRTMLGELANGDAIAARALRADGVLEKLVPDKDPAAAAARSLAALARSQVHDAQRALDGIPASNKTPLVLLARAATAEYETDDAQLETRIKAALASEQWRAALAIGANLPIARISPALHGVLLKAAEKPGVGVNVASKIGLRAAGAGVDVPRALALISVRDLEADDLPALDALVGKGGDPTLLRLRAELSLRRGDGLEGTYVADYIAAAPNDVRAHRYRGWVLAAERKWTEAALELGRGSSPPEEARALLAAGDPRAALRVLGTGPATSAEHNVVITHVALLDKRIATANDSLATAEKLAPLSADVQRAVVALDAVQPDPARVAIAHTVLAEPHAATDAVATTTKVESKAATTTVVGIAPALLEPLLGRLDELQRLRTGTLAIAEITWDRPWYSFKVVHSAPVKATLLELLSSPPYKLDVKSEPALDDASPSAEALGRRLGDAEGLVLYQVTPGTDGQADVTLSFYARGASQLSHVSTTIRAPGLVETDSGKIKALVAFFGVLVLAAIVYITRAKGTIRLKVARAPDVSDEVLCVEVSKSPQRPRVDDPVAFAREIRKEGTVHKRHQATLIASGHKLHVSAGHWYVHLYGAFTRAGKPLAVPSSCTQEVDLERGAVVELEFNLTSKMAELRVEIAASNRRGIAVWITKNDHEKVYTDDNGVASLEVPVGTHTLVIDAHGKRFERQVPVTAPKQHRISFNVARELRIEEGVALDLGVSTPPAAGSQVIEPRPTPVPAAASPLPARFAVAQTAPLVTPPLPRPDVTQAAYSEALSQPIQAQSIPATGRRPHTRAATPQPGDVLLARYRITAELGRGAMGVVHRAWDEKLERDVAIKEMADNLRTNTEAMRLFEQEAKALAQLNHTNIVGMYDQITDASGVYMIMEFVDGRPLADIVQERGALPWLEAVNLVHQVITGLAYAHARKVIHRDIKPANCFVGIDRTVKLGDFGLARVMREVSLQQTQIRGTPLYMAPEQITGTNVDHRADLYAIGCMLFELVTGRPPFIDGDILYAQMHLPAPRASSLVEIPPALDELLLSLLAKQADDRPGSANEVQLSLKQIMGT